MTEVIVRKLKFDGSVRYEWDGDVVGERPGWLVVLHHPERHSKQPAEPTSEYGYGLRYVGLEAPVTVLFWFDEKLKFADAKCDAALPAQRHGQYVDFVDMDLDVVVLPGLNHYVRDQEAFAERSVSMGYSEAAKRLAHVGILESLRMVRRRRFPFDGDAERLIAELLGGVGGRK